MIPKLIERALLPVLRKKAFGGKALIILGPRQTGKTTLLRSFVSELNKEFLWLNCDDPAVRPNLEDVSLNRLKTFLKGFEVVVIDEAQRVKNIGITMKLITDEIASVQLLVSGSSALDLANEINEPLTGRKWEYFLFPISWLEYENYAGSFQALQNLNQRIVFGMYPDVIVGEGEEKTILSQLAGSYLFKDILNVQGIRKPELLDKLLKALAFQLGNEVSFNELARMLEVDRKTVESYIYLLEQAFIITRLQPFSRNLRSEINTSRKIYFWDTGIRNALIGNYESLPNRQDAGALWENFLLIERIKHLHYNSIHGNRYFWRTKMQQEIDYIEERDGRLFAYEFKMNPKAKYRFSKSFTAAYPEASTTVISTENFNDFLTQPF